MHGQQNINSSSVYSGGDFRQSHRPPCPMCLIIFLNPTTHIPWQYTNLFHSHFLSNWLYFNVHQHWIFSNPQCVFLAALLNKPTINISIIFIRFQRNTLLKYTYILRYKFSDMFRHWLRHYQGDVIQGVTQVLWVIIFIWEYNLWVLPCTRYRGSSYTHTHTHTSCGRGLHELHFVMDKYIHITCITLNCISLMMAQLEAKHVRESIM